MLTTVQILALRLEARPYKVPDRDGLFLLVQPTGALLWRFRYKVFGVERKLSLGTFPEVSLLQARRLRDDARADIEEGGDPAAEKRQKRLEAELAAKTTFELVANEYIQKMEREGRLTLLVRGGITALPILAQVFDVVFLDTDVFMRSMNRQSAVRVGNTRLHWESTPTPPGEALDDLFERNADQREALVRMAIAQQEAPVAA